MKQNRVKSKLIMGFWILTAGILLTAMGSIPGFSQEITPEIYSQLRYRYIGPPGNRTSAVAAVPGDPLVYYIGAASGGIWKSTDGGTNWRPIFDDQPAQ